MRRWFHVLSYIYLSLCLFDTTITICTFTFIYARNAFAFTSAALPPFHFFLFLQWKFFFHLFLFLLFAFYLSFFHACGKAKLLILLFCCSCFHFLLYYENKFPYFDEFFLFNKKKIFFFSFFVVNFIFCISFEVFGSLKIFSSYYSW